MLKIQIITFRHIFTRNMMTFFCVCVSVFTSNDPCSHIAKEDCMRFSCHFTICTVDSCSTSEFQCSFQHKFFIILLFVVQNVFIYWIRCDDFSRIFVMILLVFMCLCLCFAPLSRRAWIGNSPKNHVKECPIATEIPCIPNIQHNNENITTKKKTQSKRNRIVCNCRCNVCPFHFLPLVQLIFHNIADQILFIHFAVFWTQMKRVQFTHTRPMLLLLFAIQIMDNDFCRQLANRRMEKMKRRTQVDTQRKMLQWKDEIQWQIW